MPLLQGSFSPLPEGTSLAPLKDFLLTVFTGESARKLTEFTIEQIQISNPNEFVDLVEDWELRTHIAPPLTSLEGARVISISSTSKGKELVWSDVRQIQSETHA